MVAIPQGGSRVRSITQPNPDKAKTRELRRLANREMRQVVDFDTFMKYRGALQKTQRAEDDQ